MLDAFHLYEKENVFSGGKSNGTDLFNGNFSEDLEHLQRQSFFLIFTGMTEKLLLFAFLHYSSLIKYADISVRNETVLFPGRSRNAVKLNKIISSYFVY